MDLRKYLFENYYAHPNKDKKLGTRSDSKTRIRLKGTSYLLVYLNENNARSIYINLTNPRGRINKLPTFAVTVAGTYGNRGRTCVVAFLEYPVGSIDVKSYTYFKLTSGTIPYIYNNSFNKNVTEEFVRLIGYVDNSISHPKGAIHRLLPEKVTLEEICSDIIFERGCDVIEKYDLQKHSFIAWDGDYRAILSDKIKVILGFRSLIHSMLPSDEYSSSGYLLTPYHQRVTLKDLHPSFICEEDIERIRITFALRYTLGMRSNIESNIYIIDGEPCSLIDIFPSKVMNASDPRIGLISQDMYAKWFGTEDPLDYVRRFPVFNDAKENLTVGRIEEIRAEIMDRIKSENNNNNKRKPTDEERCDRIFNEEVKTLKEISEEVIEKIYDLLSNNIYMDWANVIVTRIRSAANR